MRTSLTTIVALVIALAFAAFSSLIFWKIRANKAALARLAAMRAATPATPTATPAATPAGTPAATGPLSETSLRADLERLCDPALNGRGTLNGGSALAAKVIVAEFKKAGLSVREEDFRSTVREALPGSTLSFMDQRLEYGRDWTPLCRSPFPAAQEVIKANAARGVAARISHDKESLKGRFAVEELDAGPGMFRTLDPPLVERALRYQELGAIGVLFLAPRKDPDAGGEAVSPQRVTSYGEMALAKEPEEVRPWLRRRAWIGAVARTPRGSGVLTIPALLLSHEAGARLTPQLAPRVFPEVTLDWTAAVTNIDGHNVIATIEGTKSSLPDILVSAHFDSHGVQPASPGFPDGRRYVGACDNASGVAVLLAVARTLVKTPLTRNVVFVAFDAEELGLRGSQAFVEARPNIKRQVFAQLNIDMAGRGGEKEIYVVGGQFCPRLAALIEPSLIGRGFTVNSSIDFSFRHGSDHWPLCAAGVPGLLLTCGRYPEKDRPEDTPDLVSDAKMVRLAESLVGAIKHIAEETAAIPPPENVYPKFPGEK